ncbi:SDR family NAD(P)-dependent oxidoreductase [Paractinoplanes lichenicola]|uniref:SDR family oxidoreductase n=1 Tax=Paractinoplanes lichenicola TaxID=2802976 RepID=A0ABS1VZ56_9ACTN|nr:SDR family oxidoreductase [Actinoplanes lichenicola]MBL7259737.1 SDR family oxidoreductase [Actinoplanes lichenicola]
MMLMNKTAVVYGGSGHVGGAVARVFAREGARVFLAGRKLDELEKHAAEIGAAGAAYVDATDRDQVEAHLDAVGPVDVSVNAVSLHGTVMGTPLTELDVSDFLAPVSYGLRAHFVTATASARRMAVAGSGTILTFSTTAARLSAPDQRQHRTGGFGTACAAIEAMTMTLAGEVGPLGVRVVCLRPDAMPETWGAGAEPDPQMQASTALGRMPTLAQVAETAAFVASDRAGAMTRTVVNLSCGSVLD